MFLLVSFYIDVEEKKIKRIALNIHNIVYIQSYSFNFLCISLPMNYYMLCNNSWVKTYKDSGFKPFITGLYP